MKPQYIFGKTTKGEDAMRGDTNVLDQRFLRFLGLVDGRRSIAELKTVSRPSEIDETLSVLLEQAYIEKVGEADPSRTGFGIEDEGEGEVGDPFAEAALTPEMFAQIKRRAVRDLRLRAATLVDPVAAQIEACETPEALRIALRAAGSLLSVSIGAKDAREFLQGVGRNLVA